MTPKRRITFMSQEVMQHQLLNVPLEKASDGKVLSDK